MKILLVEDDDRIARPLIEDLRAQKHSIDYAQVFRRLGVGAINRL